MESIPIGRRMLPGSALADAGFNHLFTCEELVGAAAKELAAFLTVGQSAGDDAGKLP